MTDKYRSSEFIQRISQGVNRSSAYPNDWSVHPVTEYGTPEIENQTYDISDDTKAHIVKQQGLGPSLIPPSVLLLVKPFPTPGVGPDCLISPSDRPSKKLSIALLAAEFLDFMVLKGRASVVSMKKREFTIRRMTKKLRDLSMVAMLSNEGDELMLC
ncbi:hypothetical protein NC651_034792 [Populus alba x Populus x berolinensis]|nr:hypothetical protein NC651_034792 [Populus alba x Populus x berolinensis]